MPVDTAPTVEPLLIGLVQAAALIGISLPTAKRMAAANELPGLRRLPGRRRVLVAVLELRQWIADGCPPVTPAHSAKKSRR